MPTSSPNKDTPLKKLLISIAGALVVAAGLHAQTTTYTGQIKDLALNPVTSGQVTFTLAPSTDSTMPGTGRFTPQTITCNISGSGTLSASGGFGACTVASNTALSPAGTSYRICIQPGFATTGSCFYDYATGGTKDISTIAPTLRTGPLNYNGVQGPPIDVQGVWSSTQTYSKGQVVSYNNVIYLSLVASSLNQTPSTSPSAWSVVMSPPAVISNPSLSQTITQAPGTSLTVNILCSGTGPINARTCFGATGNANGNSGGCSITAGTTTLTCPSGLNFNAADIGKTMYIAGAGSGGGTLQTSITNINGTNGTVVFVGNNAVTTVTGAAVFYATDDTVALQHAFNFARTQGRPLYIPAGIYLHHGLDFTGADSRIFGDSSYAVTALVGAAVTNPTKVNSGPTVGIDISGSTRNVFDHLNVWGGWQNGMGDLAPTINVLAARTTSDFATDHTFDEDYFVTFGAYDVFLYGYEQTSFKDCTFEGAGTTQNGLLYISSNNTPGFQSPYRTFVSAPTSMTKVSSFGAASQFSGVGNHVVLDQGGAESDYTISIQDAFISLGGGGTWLSDTGGAAVRDVELSNDYAEFQSCPTCRMIKMTAPAWMWDIRTVQAYNGGGLTVSPYTFAGGILGSYMQVDATGSSQPALTASTCRGSIINMGQQQPTASCQDYALAPNVNTGGGVQAVNNIAGVANIPMSGTSTIGAGYGNNATNGGGETDLYNMFFGGGFTFWSNSSSGYNLLGSLDSAGMHIPTGTRYRVGTSQGFTGTKTVGTCVFTIIGGIITNVTGC
jgi:hypothetical protein